MTADQPTLPLEPPRPPWWEGLMEMLRAHPHIYHSDVKTVYQYNLDNQVWAVPNPNYEEGR